MKLSDRVEMTISEAIRNSGDNWFRPVKWGGAGMAYCLKNGSTHLVPSLRGGDCSMTHDADALAGDWEIVTPDTVLGER